MQYLFSTGSSQTTSELIGHLEMAMRRSPTKPKLPAVKELSYEDMHILRNSILTDTAVHPVRKLFLEIVKARNFVFSKIFKNRLEKISEKSQLIFEILIQNIQYIFFYFIISLIIISPMLLFVYYGIYFYNIFHCFHRMRK